MKKYEYAEPEQMEFNVFFEDNDNDCDRMKRLVHSLQMVEDEKLLRHNPKGHQIVHKVPVDYEYMGIMEKDGVKFQVFQAPLKTDTQLLEHMLTTAYSKTALTHYRNKKLDITQQFPCICCSNKFELPMFSVTKDKDINNAPLDYYPICRYCFKIYNTFAKSVLAKYGRMRNEKKESFLLNWNERGKSLPLIVLDSVNEATFNLSDEYVEMF